MADYSVKDLISQRKSVRTYDETPLRTEDRQKLEAYAQSLQNPFDVSVTFRILDAKDHKLSSPVVLGADTYLGAKVARTSNAEIALGYDFERFVLYAQSLGIGTVWLAATIDRPAFERAMDVRDGEVMPAVSPLGYPAAKKSVRESLMRKSLKADNRLPLNRCFSGIRSRSRYPRRALGVSGTRWKWCALRPRQEINSLGALSSAAIQPIFMRRKPCLQTHWGTFKKWTSVLPSRILRSQWRNPAQMPHFLQMIQE